MARFMGTVAGQRGPASRLGSEKSGLRVTANGWDIGCTVTLNAEGKNDRIYIYLTSGSNGGGESTCIFSGTLKDALKLARRRNAARARGLK